MMLCEKCGRSKLRICFPPIPYCTCDRDYSWLDELMKGAQVSEETQSEPEGDETATSQPGAEGRPEGGMTTPAGAPDLQARNEQEETGEGSETSPTSDDEPEPEAA